MRDLGPVENEGGVEAPGAIERGVEHAVDVELDRVSSGREVHGHRHVRPGRVVDRVGVRDGEGGRGVVHPGGVDGGQLENELPGVPVHFDVCERVCVGWRRRLSRVRGLREKIKVLKKL